MQRRAYAARATFAVVMAVKTRFFVATFVITLLLDQITKIWIVQNFFYGEIFVVLPGFFDLTHVRNPGGAFSFLADAPVLGRKIFFIGTSAVAIVLLIVLFRRLEPDARLASLALGAILGGAVGNLTDRLVYGEVIDFLDVHLTRGYTWPTFNVADSAIVVGIGILMVEVFFGEEEPSPDSASSETAD